MKTNKLWSIMMMLALVFVTAVTFSSCSKDGEDEGNNTNTTTTSQKCYLNFINGSLSQNPVYYQQIDQSISNKELLYQSGRYYYYAERDLFIGFGGVFTTSTRSNYVSAVYGKYEEKVCSNAYGYLIENTNTVCYVDFQLFVDEDFDAQSYQAKDYTKYKTVYKGNNFKSISWYVKKTYYTYTESNGKIIMSNGTILTKTANGLIPDGTATVYTLFDLKNLL